MTGCNHDPAGFTADGEPIASTSMLLEIARKIAA